MCKFSPCRPVSVHPPGECTRETYGENCDGYAHYIDDPFYVYQGLRAKLRWLCQGEADGRWMDA